MRGNILILLSMVLTGYWFIIGVDRGISGTLSSEYAFMPFDVNVQDKPPPNPNPPIPIFTQKEIYEFIWRTFIALNWPGKIGGPRGEPDTQKSLALWTKGGESEGPVVWETYRRPDQVFLPPKQWPLSWNDNRPPQICPTNQAPKLKEIPVNVTDYSENADGINQPFTQAHYPTGPAIDQNKNYLRYEVTLNQSYFSYIKFFKYYRPESQRRAVRAYINFVERFGKAPPLWQPGRHAKFFQPLPSGNDLYLTKIFKLPTYALQGIVEVKAAWKILDGDDVRERFYRRNVFFVNPNGKCTGPHLVGLVGLHIHRSVPLGTVDDFEHIGATFEHIDNVSFKDPDEGPWERPLHPSLNPGTPDGSAPDYENGYQVNGESGFSELIPAPIKDGQSLPNLSDRPTINITRQVPVPMDVKEVNNEFRDELKGSVWYYYKLIGTGHKNLNNKPNTHLGPGIAGAQTSNIQDLINTTLESYTQKGYSCPGCHLHAFPQGVTLPLPSFEQKFKALHVISFLLLNAQSDEKGKHHGIGFYQSFNPIGGKGLNRR